MTADEGRRLIVVDDGRVRAVGASVELRADELFAVLVLWPTDDTNSSWQGCLTTNDRRWMRFGPADLANAAFEGWLADLPGWEPVRLSEARARPDLHLVWRRDR